MRSSTVVTLGLASLVLGVFATSCTQDTTPTIYVDLAYQVRCLDCEPRGPDDTAHEIKVVDGEGGYDLKCSVKRASGTRRVSFTVSHIDAEQSSMNHVFKVSSADIDGSDSGSQCGVKIVEGANSYEGACSADAPSPPDVPCQAQFSEKNGVISGGVYCNNIANAANLGITRYLVAPGERTDPAKVKLYGCQGL